MHQACGLRDVPDFVVVKHAAIQALRQLESTTHACVVSMSEKCRRKKLARSVAETSERGGTETA